MVEEDAPLTPVIDPLGRDRKGETDGASVADEHALLNDTRAIELTSNVDKGDTAQDAAPDAEKAHWGRVVAQSECNPQPDEEPLAASLGRQNSSSIEQKGLGMFVTAGQFLPVLQGEVVSTCFTPERMIVDEQEPFYLNPNYGVTRFVDKKIATSGRERRQLIVEKSGPRERLLRYKSNAKDKAKTKENYELWSNIAFVIAELILHVILGWVATQVIKYQDAYGEAEWETAHCFASASGATLVPTPMPMLPTPMPAPANATTRRLNGEACAADAANIGGAFCTQSEEPPDLDSLPDQTLVYAAAGIYTFLKLFNAFAMFFSTKFEGEALFKIHGVYYFAEKLVEDFAYSLKEGRALTAEQLDAVNDLRLPELVPKARDDSLLGVGIFLFACVCVGNWLISRADVAVGLILVVLSSMGIAAVIQMHVQSMREITFLTWEVVDRVVGWAVIAIVPAIDPRNRMVHDLMEVRAEIEIPLERDSDDTLPVEDQFRTLVEQRVGELGKELGRDFPATADEFLDMAMKDAGELNKGTMGNYQTGIWREKGKVQIQRGKFRQRASSSWDEIKKHEYVNKLDSWARGADAMAFIVLFMFLGIIAAQVVEYQINHQQLYCACISPTCEEDDEVAGRWSQDTLICGTENKPCPHPDGLPGEYWMYVAAVSHAVLITTHAVLQYISRSAAKIEVSKARSTFAVCLSYTFPDDDNTDLVPDEFDVPSICAGIASIVFIMLGVLLIYKNLVTTGMVLSVLSARLLAYIMTNHIQTDAATDIATYQFVERIAKMSLWSDALDAKHQKLICGRIRKLEQSRSLMKKPPGVTLRGLIA